MKKLKKLIIIFFSIIICLLTLHISVFAGNNDSLPSKGYIGSAADGWSYSSHNSGIRVSIYWAQNNDSFKEGNEVVQVGKTIDITKTNPRYKIEAYTEYSIYGYMNCDSFGNGLSFKKKISSAEPYTWIGTSEVYNIKGQDIVQLMPDIWTGTKTQWDDWFEGPIDSVTGEKGYENISAIAELCGTDIKLDDFKNGFLDINGYKSTGIYKIFFEPIIYPLVDGVSMAMTLRDLIRWEEAFHRNDISTSDGKDLIEWITPVFVFTSNSQFLIENEAAISMLGKSNECYKDAYKEPQYNYPLFEENRTKASSYKAVYDSPDITERRAQRAVIKEQLNPLGGIIYNSMGVGVITPEPQETKADFDIIYNSEIVTDDTVQAINKEEEQDILLSHTLLAGSYKAEDLTKVEYYTLNNSILPDDVVTNPGELAAAVLNPATVPIASIKVMAATGAGSKTTLGMKLYFKDGTVYPSADGTTYKERYIIHHITLISLGDLIQGVNEYFNPHAGAVIKADQRDNEHFNVNSGVPSGETLYTNIIANEFLYSFVPHQVTGSVDYTVTVNYEESVIDENGEEVLIPHSSSLTFSKSYSYWEISSLEIYAIDEAAVNNEALPGGSIRLTPGAAYHAPNVDYSNTASHVSTGSRSITTTCSSSDSSDIREAARNAVPTPTVRNDRLIVNGRTVMSDGAASSVTPAPILSNLEPADISRDALYAKGLRIPENMSNGSKPSTGSITYSRVFSLNPSGQDEMTFPIPSINNVFVHTPVYVGLTIDSDNAHNQKANPASNASAVILGRPFTLEISSTGMHRDIKGYGSRDYTEYMKDREIRFEFDTYLGTSMEGTYLKAGTWYSLEGLGVENNVTNLTFYTPTWVDEGSYNIEVRCLAINDEFNGDAAQDQANLNPAYTIASISRPVEVSGRVYDLAITDIDDISWELFFRRNKGEEESTGKVFYTGPNNINGDSDPDREYFFPVMPGKNDVRGYQNRAVKLGYSIKFDIKTMGNYYDKYDFVRIMPTFAYVDKDGRNRKEVDLYYSTPEKPLIKVGSSEDVLTQTMKLNFKYRGIDMSEFTGTAEAIFSLRGGMEDFTLDKWKEGFPKISQNGVVSSKYFKILLSEPVRSFVGPDRGIPEGVNPYKALASVQKWYGEYLLPSDLLAVPKGTDLSKHRNLTQSSPVFLKDGYILVNFRDIGVINDDNFDQPSLMYSGGTGNGWNLEGYSTDQGGWQLTEGDVLVYYVDKRATDDITGTGTH